MVCRWETPIRIELAEVERAELEGLLKGVWSGFHAFGRRGSPSASSSCGAVIAVENGGRPAGGPFSKGCGNRRPDGRTEAAVSLARQIPQRETLFLVQDSIM